MSTTSQDPGPASATRAVRRPRLPRTEDAPLGSLTQADVRPPATCAACGGSAVTELSMLLTDGTPVRFTSCRSCEHRRWEADGEELAIGDVLDRSRG